MSKTLLQRVEEKNRQPVPDRRFASSCSESRDNTISQPSKNRPNPSERPMAEQNTETHHGVLDRRRD